MKGLPTDKEMVILRLLTRPGRKPRELFGQQMVDLAPEELSENSIYMLLTRMVARSFVTARYQTDQEQAESGRGPKRRLYTVTGYGRQAYEQRLAAERSMGRVAAKWGQIKPEGAL
jgi:DNA-binding PadR family transcriptional regulator